MQILYDHQVFSWQKYGGISRYFYEIIRRISQEKDCNVDLFQGFHINKYGLEQNKKTYKNYVSIPRKIIPKTGRLFNLLSKMMLYKFSSNQIYDIYHPTYYKTFSLKKRHLIVTVYDMIHEIFYNKFHDRTSDDKKRIIKAADGIIAISESTKKDLIRILGIQEDKIKVIYLANSLCKGIEIPPVIQENYILYVGNRGGYKNFLNILTAFSISKFKNDFTIACFGGGDFNKHSYSK